jgi:hypothetical protein
MKLSIWLTIFMLGAWSENMCLQSRPMGDWHYGTHMAPLLTAITHTQGPILEMGAGDYSTPLIHAVCSKNHRRIVTVETDHNWLTQFLDLKTTWHTLVYLPVYHQDGTLRDAHLWNTVGEGCHWGIIFVDHRPGERRVVDILRLKGNADIMVVHDTEEASYHFEPALNQFKYRYDYKRYTVYTTLVSDTIDVQALFIA